MSPCSRRNFLTGGMFRRTQPAEAVPSAGGTPPPSPAAAVAPRGNAILPLLRPPGALPEAEFLATCTRCMECLAACPHGAIRPASPRFRGSAGTPMVSPYDAPCRMCPDTPCITACKPRALARDPQAGLPSMGLATLLKHNCLAHQGTTCTTCVERCPVPGALRLTSGKPGVDPSLCTGCGVCQHVCPAPANAILLMPSRRDKARDPHAPEPGTNAAHRSAGPP